MSREIRRVPADWEHPKDPWRGETYQALLKGPYDEQWSDFYRQHELWEKDQHPHQLDAEFREGAKKYRWRHEYGGFPARDRSAYMEHYIGGRECTHWQLYESVSEGTPVSPVFATDEDLFCWMLTEGYDDWAISDLIKFGCCSTARS